MQQKKKLKNMAINQEYEEGIRSILLGRDGWDDEYSTISAFKQDLREAGLVEQETEPVFYHHSNHTSSQLEKIIWLLRNMQRVRFGFHYLVRFWAVMKVEGRHHRLSNLHQPFCVSHKPPLGACWYRNVCMDGVYDVDMEGVEGGEQLGTVGRAYKYKRYESTPDLKLYSTSEFPLRDAAARCGFRTYMVLPLFDIPQNECFGVLEVFSAQYIMEKDILLEFDLQLEVSS